VSRPLLELQDLRVEFATPFGTSRAVRGVDLRLWRGEIHGLVGESGCGKSLTARAVLRLLPGSASLAGRILLDGEDILGLPEQALSRVRGRRVAMVFQNPMEALNPVFTLGQQLAAVLRHHGVVQGRGIRERAVELLADVGLPEPRAMLSRYPHQLSGGMQQRAMIALALAPQPELIIADEPTTALDVTIQAQILDLLKSLRDARGIGVLLITHDMGVVAKPATEWPSSTLDEWWRRARFAISSTAPLIRIPGGCSRLCRAAPPGKASWPSFPGRCRAAWP
jgi:peptide/nickel transport system ATP-binding protein